MTSVQFDGTDQPAGQPASAPQQNTTPDVLTDELEARIEKAVNRAFRGIQSSQAKQEKRIKEFVQQQVSLLHSSGVDVTPEMERNIAKTVREQIPSDGEEAAVETPAPAAKTKTAPAPTDPSEAWAIAQGDAFEVEPLNAEDPEAAMLKEATDFKSWKRLVVKATEAKAERLAQSPTPPTKPIPNAVGAAGVDTQASLTDAYKTEMLANRGKRAACEAIQQKYTKLGLDIGSVSFR
jgi:hypothetical protein